VRSQAGRIDEPRVESGQGAYVRHFNRFKLEVKHLEILRDARQFGGARECDHFLLLNDPAKRDLRRAPLMAASDIAEEWLGQNAPDCHGTIRGGGHA
jgi:hypothetical protein